MRKVLAHTLFTVIEVVLLPITGIGYVWLVTKLLLRSRRTGVSTTAYSPLGMRWALHESGVRRDDATQRILLSLSGGSLFAWRMTMGPTFWAMRLTGVTPRMMRYPAVRPSTLMSLVTHRTEFFDTALRDYLERVRQFVILGAGWDARAYNIPHGSGVRVFEVDQAETQEPKRAALQKAGIDTAHVTFVVSDFNTEPWLETLKRHGFDPDLPTFFLWEGVMYYLEPESVAATLDTVASQCAAGTVIAFDYFGTVALGGNGPLLMHMAAKMTHFTKEPWRFAIATEPPARAQVAKLLEVHGLKLERYEPIGIESVDRKPFGGLAVARQGKA